MSGTQSVLDQMAAGIMGRKQEKAATLTPVGLEAPAKPAIAEARGDVFPHDGGIQSQIVFSAKIIRESIFQMGAQLAGMEECLRSIEREVGLAEPLPPAIVPPVPPLNEEVVRAAAAEVVAEITAKPTFDDEYKAKQADAQAQVFTSGDASDGGWVCPTHGTAQLTTLTSRRGRKYRSCIGCDQFERIA